MAWYMGGILKDCTKAFCHCQILYKLLKIVKFCNKTVEFYS